MRDAASVAVAKQSGCIFIGKTVSTELGHRAPGLTTNPHNKDFTPGGSSSGSAAAVASMMAPVCFGTQTTGSVIRPAAYCGVIGYKPSYGDFDKSGILPNSPSIDTLGLMSRSVEDIALFRSILLEEELVSIKKINLSKIKRVLLYNTKTKKIIKYLDYIDPIQGKIAGAAEEELTFKTHYDPAVYTNGTASPTTVIDSENYDLIILDTPPVKNALDFLESPGRMAQFVDKRIMKWFLADGKDRSFIRRLVSGTSAKKSY